MKTFDVLHLPPMITLGYDGENNWRPHSFNCSSLLANHPNGTISLWLLPHGETQAFPVALEREGNTVVWTPLSEEMTAATGALQLVCTDGTDVGKSAVVLFRVDESILPGAEHPAAVPSWATQVMEQYQDAVEHYPQIIDSTWHVWDVDNETWEDTGVSAQGVDGEDGHSPYIALNGHWMVYSDATGEWIDTGVSAAVDEAVIANAVAAYLDEHPITVTETDPTVPAWAKQPQKPTYTAQEVGALPADTPIPAEVTEQTVSGWGFTKNTGTYSKPSGGIPKTDLASDVQTSLGKADTALQQHQSLSGYATETWVNQQGFLKQHQDISGKADKVLRVAMASTDTTPTLDPNKLYVFPEMASLTPTLNTPSDATIVNEYHFIFTSGAAATTLTLPAAVLQPDGFTVEANHVYEVSILENCMTAQGWAVAE